MAGELVTYKRRHAHPRYPTGARAQLAFDDVAADASLDDSPLPDEPDAAASKVASGDDGNESDGSEASQESVDFNLGGGAGVPDEDVRCAWRWCCACSGVTAGAVPCCCRFVPCAKTLTRWKATKSSTATAATWLFIGCAPRGAACVVSILPFCGLTRAAIKWKRFPRKTSGCVSRAR